MHATPKTDSASLPFPALTAVIACACCLLASVSAQRRKDIVYTNHALTIDGVKHAYSASAGYLYLSNDKKQRRAKVFHVAYLKTGVVARERPVTFVFNGGPGSSSIWLHMGGLAPRRVAMSDQGEPLRPPGRAVPSLESWLPFTDLVFIDPVGTGYSRPVGKAKQAEFSGLKEDTESVGDFIRLWTTKARRWGSPKFLCGESYGTTRAASLAGYLQDEYRMYLNGIVLVSAVLNFQTIRFHIGNDLPHALFVPSFAATARYHGKLRGELAQLELPQLLRAAETFALGDYTSALAQGNRLSADRRDSIADLLASFCGVSKDFVLASNLRLDVSRFTKELMRSSRQTVGRLDSRLRGSDREAHGARYEFDPSMAAIDGPYTQALLSYLRNELRFEEEARYRVLTGKVHPWSFKQHENRYVNVGETLRRAMHKNRHLKVLFASGYYDLATPYFASDYTVSHLQLDKALEQNVRVTYYESGHMMYIHAPSRRKLVKDARDFYAWALE